MRPRHCTRGKVLLFGVWLGQMMLLGMVLAQSAPKVHELRPAPDTVHRGFFDASLKPVLTIDSGDSVWVWTASGNPRYYENLGVPKEKIPPELYRVYDGVEDARRWDHTLSGPIFVNNAQPGDTLEIRIRAIDLWLPIAGQGMVPNRGLLPEEFPYARDRVLWLDLESKTVEYLPGIILPLIPFWGVIGVAPPPGMGRVPSGPPNVFGGDMDNRDLGPGSTLYLPVHVPGALLSLGDGHAAQGHGEVCLSAIETSIQGEIQVVLHKGKRILWPRAETPTHYMTMGLHTDLDEATKIATREMLDWLAEMKGLTREDAYMLSSPALDLVVTQVVDITKGIHALMPKAIFQQ
jgi:acetamidase/formamidase